MRDDPFAQLGGLDQKLFGAKPRVSALPLGKAQSSPRPKDRGIERTNDRSIGQSSGPAVEPTNEAAMERSPEGPTERSTERHSYDFYHDQVQWLNRMKVQIEERYRCKLTANQIVQLALDLFMADYRRSGPNSALVRHLVHREPITKGADDRSKDRRIEPSSEGS